MTNDGFTLIEIIIGTAILSVTMVVAVVGFTAIVQLQQKAQTVQDVQQNARYIVETISRDVRNSDAYQLTLIPGANGAVQLELPNNINDNDRVRYTYNPEANGKLYRYLCETTCSGVRGVAGQNMVPDGMRLTRMDMEKLNQQLGANSPLRLYITLVNGEDLRETDPYYYEYEATTMVVPRR